jgi:site-specific DNA-methyltransferase (adenine-specific)
MVGGDAYQRDTVRGKKKGADTGIDGYYYCKPDGKKTEAGIVSVKGGDNLHRDMVSDLRGVMERKNAPLAVLITLRKPTAPMVKEAAAEGFLDTPFNKFAKLQKSGSGSEWMRSRGVQPSQRDCV